MNEARIALAPLALSSIAAGARFRRSRRTFSKMELAAGTGNSLSCVGRRSARDCGEGS